MSSRERETNACDVDRYRQHGKKIASDQAYDYLNIALACLGFRGCELNYKCSSAPKHARLYQTQSHSKNLAVVFAMELFDQYG